MERRREDMGEEGTQVNIFQRDYSKDLSPVKPCFRRFLESPKIEAASED